MKAPAVALLAGAIGCETLSSAEDCPAWTLADGDRCVLRAWDVPGVDDALSEPGAREVQLAVGTAGDAIVAWAHASADEGFIVIAESVGAGWSTIDLHGDEGVGIEPAVAVGAGGEAMVAWKQQTIDGAVFLATRDADRNWDLPTSPISWGETAYEPRVDFASDGEAFVVWNQWTGTNFGVAVAVRSGTGTAFDVPRDAGELLSAPVNYANAPRVALGAAGEALIAWYQAPVDDLMVYVSERRGSDAAFDRAAADAFVSATGAPVDSHAEANAWPAVHASGAAAVVWTQQQRDAWDIAVFVATRDANGEWATPASRDASISEPGAFARCPQAAFTPGGELIVTWYETRDDDTGVFVWDGEAPLRLSGEGGEAVHPALAVDADGGVMIVWAENRIDTPDTWRVVARRYQPEDARWLDAETISTVQAGLAPTPQIDVASDSGAVTVAWAQGGVLDGRVYVATLP